MKEFDIRPKNLLEEYLRLSAADTALFFSDRSQWRDRPCPGCGETRTTGRFEKNGFSLVRCLACSTLYAAAVPGPAQLAEFYRASPSQKFWAETFFPSVAEARRAVIFRPRVERAGTLLADIGIHPHTLIDVGAGAGIFLEECRAARFGSVWRAVEPNEILAQTCRDKGFDVFAGFAADAERLWRGSADLVTSFEVIEHLIDPAAFLRDIAALTRPGGFLLLTGVCGTGFDILTLQDRANAVFPPHHLTFLSHRGVSALLERCGLEEISFLTPGRLDVDIVRNAHAGNPDDVADPFLRHLLFVAGEDQRERFQNFLAEAELSSHMWIVARRPTA